MATLITQRYKNFVAGISQQPAILRHPEQLEEQLNGLSTEAGGLQKRPPTLHVGKLEGFPQASPFVHFINRDDSEKYIIAIDGTQSTPVICAYNAFTGKRITVNVSDINYLKCKTNLTDLKMITIADYTFIVNRSKTVSMSNEKSPNKTNQGALIHVKSGQYGRTYKVRLNGSDVCAYQTPDGSKSEHVSLINTNFIVDKLAEGARNNGWSVWTGPSWLYIFKDNTTITKVEAYDNYNNQAMFGILKQVQTFNHLPSSAPNGFVCEVVGEKKTVSDDYYVQYDANAGIWKETVAPNSFISFNNNTMPHVLIRGADGNFTFKPADWSKKLTGDDNSNPEPSFIGDTINDVFFYRNRLGFLSGENIILSNSSDFFNFWMTSATSVRDTDPIDIAVSDNKIAILYQAVPFGDDLVLFSGTAQFSLRAEGVLTPSNAKVNTMTYFSSDPRVKPVGVGRNIYFTVRRSNYTSVKEYFTAFDDTDKRDAQDITSHVPNYIPNGVFKLIPSTIDNIILAISKATPDTMYVYKFLFLDGVKQQSSWSKWTFGGTILGAEFMESSLYITTKRDGEVFLEILKLAYNTKDFDKEPYRIYLDRKVEITTSVYDDVKNTTTFNIKDSYKATTFSNPYDIVTSRGEIIECSQAEASDGLLTVRGDYRNQIVYVGIPYSFKMALSTLMIKRVEQGNTTTTSDGRLQIQTLWFNYVDSGAFKVQVVSPSKNNLKTYVRSLYNLNGGQEIDTVTLLTGTFKVPIHELNTKVKITLESPNPTPVAIVGGGYQGRYTRRTRQIE